MHKLRSRQYGACAGLGACALILSSCGTQVSDSEIERAANGVARSGSPLLTQLPADSGSSIGSGGAVAGLPTGAATLVPGEAAVGPSRTGPTSDPAGPEATHTGARGGRGGSGTSSGIGDARTDGGVQVADKRPITVGVVGTFSGPLGGMVKSTATGTRIWARWVNAHGGVNGHPVNLVVGDDQGDPARFNSLVQQFVEESGAIAFLFTTLGMGPNGNNTYLDSKKILTFGTENGLATAYNNPYVVTAVPTGPSYAKAILFSAAKVAVPAGKTRMAEFTCSDFRLCDLFDKQWSDPAALESVDFTLVKRGRPSMTQPDFTSECLSAKQARAEVVLVGMDTASIQRMASACARQDYHPIFSTADLLATPSLPDDPLVDGAVIGTNKVTFMDKRVPGIAELYRAVAEQAPDVQVDGGIASGWLFGNFFAAAAANLPDKPTAADVVDGLYRIKNNTLKGMTYPLTFTQGRPSPRRMCYAALVVRNKTYVQGPGASLNCP